MVGEFDLDGTLERALSSPRAISVDEMARLLALSSPADVSRLHAAARALKLKHCGRGISVRGLVEAGNICAKDCLYCGIRKSNRAVERYSLTPDEIIAAAEEAKSLGYASLVIQSGEVESDAHTRFIEDVLRRIAPLDLGVTLSLGEQTEDVYARWREAGAERYLLRIETSDPKLYAAIHPAECSWARRVECLRALRRTGYQVGTGVMCALPGQTFESLANDIKFYGEIDADMIGMGPYIPHPATPLAPGAEYDAAFALRLGLNMIAVTRLYLHDVNIAAATALQALAPDGRERGVEAGANVIMPNVTATRFRKAYKLYSNKPCLDETAKESRDALEARLAAIGEELLFGRRGDSPHFHRRTEQ